MNPSDIRAFADNMETRSTWDPVDIRDVLRKNDMDKVLSDLGSQGRRAYWIRQNRSESLKYDTEGTLSSEFEDKLDKMELAYIMRMSKKAEASKPSWFEELTSKTWIRILAMGVIIIGLSLAAYYLYCHEWTAEKLKKVEMKPKVRRALKENKLKNQARSRRRRDRWLNYDEIANDEKERIKEWIDDFEAQERDKSYSRRGDDEEDEITQYNDQGKSWGEIEDEEDERLNRFIKGKLNDYRRNRPRPETIGEARALQECAHMANCPMKLATSSTGVCNVKCNGHNCIHWIGCKPAQKESKFTFPIEESKSVERETATPEGNQRFKRVLEQQRPKPKPKVPKERGTKVVQEQKDRSNIRCTRPGCSGSFRQKDRTYQRKDGSTITKPGKEVKCWFKHDHKGKEKIQPESKVPGSPVVPNCVDFDRHAIVTIPKGGKDDWNQNAFPLMNVMISCWHGLVSEGTKLFFKNENVWTSCDWTKYKALDCAIAPKPAGCARSYKAGVPVVGEEIWVVGWDCNKQGSKIPHVSHGYVEELQDPFSHLEGHLCHTATTTSSLSGSAVFNKQGVVVGIHTYGTGEEGPRNAFLAFTPQMISDFGVGVSRTTN
jgi:hypothetical protein